LAELHQRNLIHRDIKPSNILFSADNTAKIADLGLLRTTDQDRSSLTKTGDFLGTPFYMSPEQLKGDKKLNIRCDIYSLGIVFYQCLVGNPPFYRGTLLEILQQHIFSFVPEINTHPQIFSFIKKLLAKKIEDRFQTPLEVLLQIDSLLKTAEIVSKTKKIDSAKTVVSNSVKTVVLNSAKTVVNLAFSEIEEIKEYEVEEVEEIEEFDGFNKKKES